MKYLISFIICTKDGKWKCKSLNHVRLFATPWTVALQTPLSRGFSSQEYWNGLPFPSPGYLPKSGIELKSPALQADSLSSELPEKPPRMEIRKIKHIHYIHTHTHTHTYICLYICKISELIQYKETAKICCL